MNHANALRLWMLAVGMIAPAMGLRAEPVEPCARGWWADAMVGSYHVRPYRHFDDVNPGAGIECSVTEAWTASVGYFRNSLDRPSFYGGAIFTPKAVQWQRFEFGLMGGIISGYNYGRFGAGGDHRTGPLLAPAGILRLGRFAANFVVIPPIPSDRLPFTIGLQAKVRIH